MPIPPVKIPEKVALEAYRDLLQPLVREIGGDARSVYVALRDVFLKVVRNPEYLPVAERLRAFMAKSIAPVPASQREMAPQEILGPVLDAIQFETPNSAPGQALTREQAFSRLLTAAFDRERVAYAHPAFPGIIRALSEDELTLVRKHRKGGAQVASGYQSHDAMASVPPAVYAVQFPFLAHPEHLLAYAEHIQSLGLITPLVHRLGDVEQSGPYSGMQAMHFILHLTHFGALFADMLAGH